MLKRLMFLIILTLSVQIVTAIYGGESETIQHFDKCSSLKISVTGALDINKTEYSFTNCSETTDNEWECNCFDGFDLIMETKINTINNYSIEIVYSYNEEVTEATTSGGHNIPKLVCGDWSECVDGLQEQICKRSSVTKRNTRNCTIEEKEPIKVIEPEKKEDIKQEQLINETKENEPEVEKFSYKWIIISIAIILVVCCLVIVYIKRR